LIITLFLFSVTTGNAALLYEYFVKGYYPLGYANPTKAMTPMGALIKAILINSAQQIGGKQGNLFNTRSKKTYPNFDQVSTGNCSGSCSGSSS